MASGDGDDVWRDFLSRTRPVMRDDAVVQGDHWRVGVLSDALVRLEWSDDGGFEDRPSQVAVTRDFGSTPDYEVSRRDGILRIETSAFRLEYDMRPFSREGLSITAKGSDGHANTWHYGDDGGHGNLLGTARTLDQADGGVPLDQGVASRDGWAVLDDSTSNVFVPDDGRSSNPYGAWIASRGEGGIDLYVFAHGHRYADAVADLYRLTGRTPLLPRWALGNWWSRYHRYSQDEYRALMDRFEAERIPLTVAVLDMDWHITDPDPEYGSGWTGYTWNSRLFPNHRAFLEDLHRRGLRVTLNVHPRDGIRAFEEGYTEVAREMGVDPKSGRPVLFDPTDPRFVHAYLDLHHHLEAEGVDFWWLDWQQGGVTRQKGLDPLWMLNHIHWLDSGRDGRWPITFSRYAGPGSHRYPVGFSGDTVVSWRSLDFQPYFTATASNVGYGWWSHDIGGHMLGVRDEELEARWYWLGTFSPINRLHSTDSEFSSKEPWNFAEPARTSMVEALRLRHRLVPYLYTMDWRAHDEGRPVVEPMYWEHPDQGEAYEFPGEYRFGTQLVVAPITRPDDRAMAAGKADVWLPYGRWFDFQTGRRYESSSRGGRRIAAWRRLDRIPVFARAGAIVPLQDDDAASTRGAVNPSRIEILAFPGADGEFVMREDDGRYCADDSRMAVSDTTIRMERDRGVITVSAASDPDVVPEVRDWTITVRGAATSRVEVDVAGARVDAETVYDESTLSLSVRIPSVSVRSDMEVRFLDGIVVAHDPWMRDAFDVLYRARMHYLTKEQAMSAIRGEGKAAVASLFSLEHGAGVGDGDAGACEGEDRAGGDLHAGHMPISVVSGLSEVLLRGGVPSD